MTVSANKIEEMKLAVLAQVTEVMNLEELEPNEETMPKEIYEKIGDRDRRVLCIEDCHFIKSAWAMLSRLGVGSDGMGSYFCMEREVLVNLIYCREIKQFHYSTRRFRVREPEAWCFLAKGLVVEPASFSIALDTAAITSGSLWSHLVTLTKRETWMLPSRAVSCDTNQVAQNTVHYVMVAPGSIVAARLLLHLKTEPPVRSCIIPYLSYSLLCPAPRWDTLHNALDASAARALWMHLDTARRRKLVDSILETAAASPLWCAQSIHTKKAAQRLSETEALLLAAFKRVAPPPNFVSVIPPRATSLAELVTLDALGDILAEAVCLPRLVDMTTAAIAPGTKNPLIQRLERAWLEVRTELAQRAADELLLSEDDSKKNRERKRSGSKSNKKRTLEKRTAAQQQIKLVIEDSEDSQKSALAEKDLFTIESVGTDSLDDDHDDGDWQQVSSSGRRSRQKPSQKGIPPTIIEQAPAEKKVQATSQSNPEIPPSLALAREISEMADGLRGIAQLRESYQLGACARLRGVAQRLWPSARLDVYGSVITGLAVPASDVDAVVSKVPQFWWTLKPKQQPLNVLAAELQLESWVSSTKIVRGPVPLVKIETAPVPTRHGNRSTIKMDVSFVHHSPFTSTPVEASVQSSSLGHYLAYYRSLHRHGNDLDSTGSHPSNGSSHNAVNTSVLNSSHTSSSIPNMNHPVISSDHMPRCGPSSNDAVGRNNVHSGVANTLFMLKLRYMFPELAPLVLVLKQLLYERGLNDPYAGGLSSYALVIMVAAVVQRYALTPPQQRPNLGALLIDTLTTYGTKSFDARKCSVQICASGPLVPLTPALTAGHVPRVGTREFFQPADPVVIQDPVDPKNNVGKSCFGFRQVQQAFDRALLAINNFSQQNNPEQRSALGAVFGSDGDTKHHDFVILHLRSVWCPAEAAGLDDQSLEEIEELRALLNTRLPLSHGDVSKVQRAMRSIQANTVGANPSSHQHQTNEDEFGVPELKEEPPPKLLDLDSLDSAQLRRLAAGLRDLLLQGKFPGITSASSSASSSLTTPLPQSTLASIEQNILQPGLNSHTRTHNEAAHKR